MKDTGMSAKLSRREFLKMSLLGSAAALVLSEYQLFQLERISPRGTVNFTSWGQSNMTFASLDLPFQEYGSPDPAGYRKE